MLAAKIEIGFYTDCFEGKTPYDIIYKLSQIQDFGCLVRMARQNEGPKGQKEIDKLEVFLDKYYSDSLTLEDIKNLKIQLSLGNITCLGVAEGDEAIAALKA